MSSFLDHERRFKTAVPMGQCLLMLGVRYEVGAAGGPTGRGDTRLLSSRRAVCPLPMSWGMWEDVPQMSILSKSKRPPQTLSPHKPKVTSRETEHKQISVTSGTVLKVTFNLNTQSAVLAPGGAGALQPRNLKHSTASATRVG